MCIYIFYCENKFDDCGAVVEIPHSAFISERGTKRCVHFVSIGL